MLSKDTLKKQARTLVAALSDIQGPVKYQDALELLAVINGHKNWKTMSAMLEQQVPPVEASRSNLKLKSTNVIRTADGDYEQAKVPGTGFLYRVPVSTDVSMSAVVLVRATSTEEAIDTAEQFVFSGNAKLTVDEESYRGRADYYCPDSSEDGVYRVEEPSNGVAVKTSGGWQVGPVLIELCDLGDGPETLLYADLTVFGPEEESGEPFSCMSCVAVEEPQEVRNTFCKQVASLLHEAYVATNGENYQLLEHVFTELVQGGVTSKSLQRMRKKFLP